MTESTEDLTQSGISVLNPDGTPSGTYLYLDHIKDNGLMTIITRWNFNEETCTNEFDGTTYQKWTYNETWIKTWSLPGYYLINGEMIQLGTTGSDGKRIVTTAQAEDYIRSNAPEIAGFGQTSKITYVRS